MLFIIFSSEDSFVIKLSNSGLQKSSKIIKNSIFLDQD